MKIRGFFALLLTGLLAAVAAFAGQPVAELYDKAEYRIAMRDSVALYTAVYTPKAPGEAPRHHFSYALRLRALWCRTLPAGV